MHLNKLKYLGTIILMTSVLFFLAEESTQRFLTPFLGYGSEYYTLADLRDNRSDLTLRMDSILQNCWNKAFTAIPHFRTPELLEDYQKAMEVEGRNMAFAQVRELPKLVTMTTTSSSSSTSNIHLILDFFVPGCGRAFGKSTMILWNDTLTFECNICEEPTPLRLGQHNNTIHLPQGEYVTFTAWMWGHYGHSTHDSLPWFAYLKEMVDSNHNNDDDSSKVQFILMDHWKAKDIITTLDPEFASTRVIWAKEKDHFVIENGGSLTTLEIPLYRDNNPRMMDFLRLWRLKAGRAKTNPQEKKIIYYDRRNPKETTRNRFVRSDIEEALLQRINEAMVRYNRTEELVIFNGLENRTGNHHSMTAEEQYQLFKDATTIIGPHGSGMSGNLLWTNPFPRNCSDRVKVLEFIGGVGTEYETSPDYTTPYVSHYPLVRGWPLEYHHMLYEPGSTRNGTILDLDLFTEVLDSMWGSNVSSPILSSV